MGRGIGRALFEHAIAQARISDADLIQIEADPNAAGFYERMGAVRIGASTSVIEDQPRELPLLEYRLRTAS